MLTFHAEETAGSAVEDTVRHMIQAANLLRARVEVKFNGIRLAAVPDCDAEDMVRRFYAAKTGDYIHGEKK